MIDGTKMISRTEMMSETINLTSEAAADPPHKNITPCSAIHKKRTSICGNIPMVHNTGSITITIRSISFAVSSFAS
jgi:hypothetical protein